MSCEEKRETINKETKITRFTRGGSQICMFVQETFDF